MTSFVNVSYPTQHPGVARVESAIDAAKQLSHDFSSTRALAKLLLSAIAAAVMVAAYQVMDSVAEGHLLVIWMTLWAVAFVVLAVFAGSTLQAAMRIRTALDAWSRAKAQASADKRMWGMAQTDARLMADLQAAQSHSEWASDSNLRFNAPVATDRRF